MLMYWVFVIILYGILILFYVWCKPDVVVHPWPLLEISPPSTTVTTCKDTRECPPDHVCMNGQCIPLFLSGEDCDPATGKRVLFEWKGRTFVVCQCTDSSLVHQKHFGGNCDVDVACAPHGRYNSQTGQCDCDPEYLPVSTTLVPTCRRMTAMERKNFWPCEADEIYRDKIKHSDGFAPEYLKTHADKKCFKRPCTFDALSGNPLKHARYEEGVGCECQPQWGHFGVRLETSGKYVRGNGPNACVSLYGFELQTKMKLFSYFYMLLRKPISFIQYEVLFKMFLQEPFKHLMVFNSPFLQIGQEWPDDPIQQFFRKKEVKNFNVRTRRCYVDNVFYIETCDEWLMQRNIRPLCRTIPNLLYAKERTRSKHQIAYELLYQAPICYIHSADDDIAEKYRGRYVSNPFHMTLEAEPNLIRSNGIQLEYKEKEWHLDFADGYDMNIYLNGKKMENIPYLHDDGLTEYIY
ncbi:hypothetical protein AVEN_149959-1 [Araneus ventricosus]|uniref:Uncharacterized protein n=1 Tax=Araneus ventricosus TaxID=182803 RepID=A0A4Y2L9Z7_ARAVE|nr:hypothetical protein AVEN_149959-1 [Araneus ventricosus]